MPALMTGQEREDFLAENLHGFSVYDKRYLTSIPNFTELPHCMYFYYLGFENGLDDVRHYFHDNGNDPIPYDSVEALIEERTKYAFYKDYVPPKHGVRFEDMVWRRKSYLAFVMDDDLLKFWLDGALVFKSKNNGTQNHSFFDGKDIEVDVPMIGSAETVKRTAFFCINHMKRDDVGNDLLPNDREAYSFALAFRLGGLPEPLEYDPGGTNLGPPLPPP